METFSALLAICAGNSPVTGEFPAQRPVTRSFDVFFDLRLNERLSKRSWGWWCETPSRPLWRHSNAPNVRCMLAYIHKKALNRLHELELENSLFDTYKYTSYMTRSRWSKKLYKYSRETKTKKVHKCRYRQSHPVGYAVTHELIELYRWIRDNLLK